MDILNNISRHVKEIISDAGNMTRACELTGVTRGAYQRAQRGDAVRLGTIETIGNKCGLSIGQMLAPPGEGDAYKDTSISNFAENLARAIKLSGRSQAEIARSARIRQGQLSNLLNAITLPQTNTLQILADELGVDAPDLFLPIDGPGDTTLCCLPMMRPGQISHVSWIGWRVNEEVRRYGLHETAAVFGVPTSHIKRITNGHSLVFRMVMDIADALELSVGEVMLDPSIDVAWYEETRPEYFVQNLRRAMDENGSTPVDIERSMAIHSTTVRNWLRGENMPRIDVLQRIADALDYEVADLFLPPE